MLFIFGKTTKELPVTPAIAGSAFNIIEFIDEEAHKASASVHNLVDSIANNVEKTNDAGKLHLYHRLASIYKDSIQGKYGYLYYLYKAAMLDNSEKNLTFAAQFYLESIKTEHDQAKITWLTKQGIALFEKALSKNPESDDLKIGLGSCFIYGNAQFGNETAVMQGVQKVLEVARKDSSNLKAQLVLGIGGFVSRQYDKALVRLLKVAEAEPSNIEATAFVADTYAAMGNKAQAIVWYEKSKKLVNNSGYSQSVDERIRLLK